MRVRGTRIAVSVFLISLLTPSAPARAAFGHTNPQLAFVVSYYIITPDSPGHWHARQRSDLVVTSSDGLSRRAIAVGKIDLDRPTWPAEDLISVGETEGIDSTKSHGIVSYDQTGLLRNVVLQGSFTSASWSPDLRHLAVERRQDDGLVELYVYRRDGGMVRRLTRGGGMHPVWSPDGRWIVFERYVFERPGFDGQEQLFIVRPDGTGLRRLTRSSGVDTSPSWSPDGRRLVFARSRSRHEQQGLYILNIATGTARRLTKGYEPAWGPHDEIAFTRLALVPSPAADGLNQLFTIRSDGRGLRQVTREPCGPANPAWEMPCGDVASPAWQGSHELAS